MLGQGDTRGRGQKQERGGGLRSRCVAFRVQEVPDTQSDAAPPPLASAKPLSKKRRKASEAEPAPKKKRKTAASASEPHAPSDADVPSPQEPHDAGPGQDGRSARAPEEHEGPHAATGGPATADDTQAARKERNQRTLFLGKCPPGMQEEHVRRLFKSVGADCVEAVNVVLDWNGKPKGCAFVAFRSAAQAQQALATTPLTLFGRTIRASACREMQDDKDLRTVRLDHCPDFVTDLTLRNQFDGLQVQHVQHVTNRKGEHSGIVFVRFHSSRDAYAAAQKQFLDVAGKRIPISRM